MKNSTKLYSVVLLALGMLTSLVSAEGPWLTDIPSAVKAAEKNGKPILVEFTGSDWCPPCKMMHERVFSKKEFLKEAGSTYNLVKIDIPKADKELRAKNEKVLEKYKVNGVPTVLLLRANGKEFNRFTATQNDTVEKFLEYIKAQKKRLSMH